MSDFSESTAEVGLPGPIQNVVARSLYQIWAIVRLTMRNLVVSKRTILMVLLACVPIGIAVIMRSVMPEEGGRPASQDLFTGQFIGLYVYFVVILTTIFYGTSLFADERSQRTITFLLIRPLPRELIVLGKFLTYVVSAGALLVASLAVTYSIFMGLDRDVTLFRQTVPFLECARAVVLAVVAYGAVFTFCGATFKRPVIAAFFYCFVWESILPYLPIFLKKLTVMHYVQSLIPNWIPQGGAGGLFTLRVEPTPPATAVWTLIGVCVAFLILTALSLRMKEYSFEKEKEL
ncbi:MAG: ABC transporter permease [bacterium]|nr:ABC transporter permease [bacterium]